MELERASVITNLQYDRIRSVQAAGNFHKAIWLLRHRMSGKLAMRKEFTPDDVRSGFAAREINHLRRLRLCQNICTYREHELNIASGTGAVVMDVYEYGDLWGLLERHIAQALMFPEAFIWHVFKSLAAALLHMQRGNPPVSHTNFDWIVHVDLYPRNIFLGLPTSHHPSWPRVVIGDFGSSVSRTQSTPNFELRQQPDFRPPEQCFPRSDVYQLGLVIVALCRLTTQPKHSLGFFPTFQKPAGEMYSEGLNNVLRKCLEVNYAARIHTLGLVQTIHRNFLGGGSMHQLLIGERVY
ncbi:NEK kinase [Pyrenophora seminiperda CCB06]|uniref:non-specific serine/threonine protein kinase n=1 Tax=Pyrenophora seminiperda CCB06 TaxID=1302712 RepID=A0A3M7LYB9_9PLEO|nr:NEK kinase [Pyrenophora seminiperda CCB06]